MVEPTRRGQRGSSDRRPIHIRREPLERITPVDTPPQPLGLLSPPVHEVVTQAEAIVDPHGVGDDLGREAMASVYRFGRVGRASLPSTRCCRHLTPAQLDNTAVTISLAPVSPHLAATSKRQ